MNVRYCEVDQCLENLCGGMHIEVDVSAGRELPGVSGFLGDTASSIAAFSNGERVLPPVGTDEVIGWDLDSTLRNTKQRHHLLPKNRPEAFEGPDARGWLEYAQAGASDEPFPAAVQLYKMLLWARCPDVHEFGEIAAIPGRRRYAMHIVSGSDDGARAESQNWLHRFGLWYDVLRLRTPEDRAIDKDVNLEHMKISYIKSMQEKGLKFALFIEDWPPLAKAIERETGVPTLVLNPCYDLEEVEGAFKAGDEEKPRSGAQDVEFAIPVTEDKPIP